VGSTLPEDGKTGIYSLPVSDIAVFVFYYSEFTDIFVKYMDNQGGLTCIINLFSMPDRNIIIKPNPFPGLRAFRPDEGHLFFGRIESTLKVVSKLKDNRFVAVLGASGSGKSSLVMSGVIPALLGKQ
jgi:ABC-type multidrug transport system fused ATPase/permease subunit